MNIRASIKQPGMFCLIWNDSGVEGGAHFTKIETISGKPEQDAALMNGLERVQTLCIKAHSVSKFFNMADEAGVPVRQEIVSKRREAA
jgi:hypothetical protein